MVLLLALSGHLFAAAPTVPSSNLVVEAQDGSRLTIDFTKGNGSSRIVVMKEGNPVTGLPENGKAYTANAVFGTTGSQFTQPGEFVVQNTSWTEFIVTNLKPGTTYHLAVFEYNGSGTNSEYLTLPLTGTVITAVAPTLPVSNITSPTQTGNTLTLNWTKGNGTGRVVIARKGAPVDAQPTDLSDYSYDEGNFGNGTKLGTDNFVVYKGSGASAVVKNLEPNTEYHFAIFEYNGSASPVYLKPGATGAFATHAGPTVAASSIGFDYVEGNRFQIRCTMGNGTRRIFVMKKGSAVTAKPDNGVVYPASAAFGTAGTEIAPGEFVVAYTTSNVVSVTNLEAGTTYYVRVYEVDVDKSGYTYYLRDSYAEKPGSTSAAPTTVATNLRVASMTGTGATIAFTPGNGTWRMVIMKEGSAVDAVPADFVSYGGNTNFGSGTQITPGNYVIHGQMNGAQFGVNALKPGVTYHMAVYEYNGYTYPVYFKAAGVFSFTMPLEPTEISKNAWFFSTEGNALSMAWANGNGSRRLLVARKGSPVTAKPVDGTSYTANKTFGSGFELAPGEFVVYDGDYSAADITGLAVGATYHFAQFEYNRNGDGKPDYLTSSSMIIQGTTATWPTTQTVITSVSSVQADRATINFTMGNGENRIFIMREGAPVSMVPQDLVKYPYSTNFGTASTHMGDGNYTVAIGTGRWPFTASGLKPLTTYHVSVFEFNGSNAPAYQRANPSTYSFTTPDVPGATVPTTAASSAQFSSIDGNKFTLKWTPGNGEKRLVVMRQGSAVDFVPASATNYTANASFGSGTNLGGGQYVVYSSNGSTVDLTNLQPATAYHFAVYEFNGTGTMIRYLTSAKLVAEGSTATPPATAATNVMAATTANSITFTWTPGSGAGRMVVLKEENAVTAEPANLSVYPASSVFKSGAQVAAGEYVVYTGAGNSVTVTGVGNKTYYYSIFEYNGSAAPVYNTLAPVTGTVVVSTPLPVTLTHFSAREDMGSVVLNWATAQEVDNEAFLVERSVDGVRYETIQRIAGAGNSTTPLQYSYTDRQLPQAERVYYRLKQVDFDGAFTYSKVETVNLKSAQGGLSVYPNPVASQFRVTLPAGVAEGVLSVFDASGVLRASQKITGTAMVNNSLWSAGTYYVQVQSGGKLYQRKIVKP